MRLLHFALTSLVLIALACKDGTTETNKTISAIDPANVIDESRQSDERVELLVLRGLLETKTFYLKVYSRFSIPQKIDQDSSFYHRGNLLRLIDLSSMDSFNVPLADPCTFDGEIEIRDLTNELKYEHPLFEVSTPDCSDWWLNEFISFQGDSLTRLFEIADGKPTQLIRKDANSLAGFVNARDEILGYFQSYPINISLYDFSIKTIYPDRQKLDILTYVLDDFQGLEEGPDNKLRIVSIKRHSEVLVDSIFRDTKQVLLRVDSTRTIISSFSDIKGKLQGNTAG